MLYNIKKSFATHEMKRGRHILYFEEYGKPDGIPVIFLHGGPGAGCSDRHKALFDNNRFRVIFLDQRGSGKSKPYRCLEENSTDLLIDDIEKIRNFLNIKSWLVVGGSWGSTLAIAYAQKFPEVINKIIVRSLFLGTKEEVSWAFYEAPKIFKPALLNDLNSIINNSNDINPIFRLGEMLDSKDINKYGLASKLWLEYESNLASINAGNKKLKYFKEYKYSLNSKSLPNTPFMEWHYIKNNFFLDDKELEKKKKIISKIPIIIIQADYDLLCPPMISYNFIRDFEKAKIYNISAAGHYISDPGIQEKMREAIDES